MIDTLVLKIPNWILEKKLGHSSVPQLSSSEENREKGNWQIAKITIGLGSGIIKTPTVNIICFIYHGISIKNHSLV